jgi:hypothetical protein
VYSNSQQFSPISVRNDLKVDPVSHTYQSQIGSFLIKSPKPTARRISAPELNPSFRDLQGQAITFPSFNFSLGGQYFPRVSEVQQATIANGEVTVTLINQMPLSIDNVALTIQSQLGRIVQYEHLAAIPPNDSARETYSLAGLTIGNLISFNLTGRVLTSVDPVVVDSSSAVLIRLDFSPEIKAWEAVAALPANSFTTTGSFVVSDSTKIDYAEISTGAMTVVVDNYLGLSGQVSLAIPELRQQDGGLFTQQIPFASAQEKYRIVFPLNGCSMRSPDGRLNYDVITRTYDTGDDFVALDSSMTVTGYVETSVLYFEKFQGSIKPTNIGTNVSTSVDLGEINRVFTGTAKFSQARVVLTITNPTQFAVDLNALLTGRSTLTGQTADLSIPQDQRRVSYPQTTITLTETNSNILSFLNSFSSKLPNEFTISGGALLNPDYVPGAVSGNDSIGIAFSIELPLMVGIVNGVARDTNEIDIGSDARKDIDRANYGKVTFEVANGLPVSIELSLDMLDSRRSRLLTLPKALQAPVAVSGAQVDALGRVVVPASSTTYLELASDDIDKIQLTEYVVYSLMIGTSAGGTVPVQFRTTDSVHVRAYSTLDYRVNSK